MTEVKVSAESQIEAMGIEITRLQRENINLRAALISLQQEIDDDSFKIGGTNGD